MKKILFLLLISIGCVNAQPRFSMMTQKLQNLASPLPEAQTIDSTRLVVLYRHTYPVDNFKDGFKQIEDVIKLQVGREVCKSFSNNLYLMDRNMTYGERNKVPFSMDRIPYTIFTNYPSGKLTVENRIPNSRMLQGSMQVVTYSEPIPQIEWNIMEQRDTIAEYSCQVAECHFRGRDWRVWYTSELPSAFSVWLFSGLPGLILKAEDLSGDYSFEATQILNKCEPIEFFDWGQIEMKRSKWRGLEKKMYDNPANYFSMNREIKIMNMETRKEIPFEEWVVRYNPIEKM